MGIRIHRALAGIALAVAAVSVQAQGTIGIGLVDEAAGPNAEAGADIIGAAMSSPPDAESMRKGIVAIKSWKGVEGTYSFEEKGDGLHGYKVAKNEGGRVTFIKHIDIKD